MGRTHPGHTVSTGLAASERYGLQTRAESPSLEFYPGKKVRPPRALTPPVL